MCAKLSDLASFAEKMDVKPDGDLQVKLTQEERDWLTARIDDELGRNKSVLQRKCSVNIKPKTRERFERQWTMLNGLKSKLC